MTDDTSFGDELIAGLEEAVAWKRGEVSLPVINVPTDYGVRIRAMRMRLGFKSRIAFGEAYGIPAKTLQNWEQGRSTPDPTARAFLRVIEAMPDATREAIASAA